MLPISILLELLEFFQLKHINKLKHSHAKAEAETETKSGEGIRRTAEQEWCSGGCLQEVGNAVVHPLGHGCNSSVSQC